MQRYATSSQGNKPTGASGVMLRKGGWADLHREMLLRGGSLRGHREHSRGGAGAFFSTGNVRRDGKQRAYRRKQPGQAGAFPLFGGEMPRAGRRVYIYCSAVHTAGLRTSVCKAQAAQGAGLHPGREGASAAAS
ncbi:MAG: hypothetical protein ACI4WS_11625 [Oscillospiraceae bacterium]